MKRHKIGRPPLPKGQAKGALLSVRFSDAERITLDEAAQAAGERLSEWARRALLKAAAARIVASEA